MIDKFTKNALVFQINGRSWTECKAKILHIINICGKVDKIIVDNELGFKAIPMQPFLKDENIEIHFTSNSDHTSNAYIERLRNTIKEHLRLLRNKEQNSSTDLKPIDILNGKIHKDKYRILLKNI